METSKEKKDKSGKTDFNRTEEGLIEGTRGA